MLRTLVTLGLLTAGIYQSGKSTDLAVPTKITATPVAFGRNQLVSMSATFKQPQIACSPVLKNRSDGFQIRLYDEKDVYGEPTWDVQQSKTTKFIAFTNAAAAPVPADDNNKVQRDFEAVNIPQSAPARIYVAVWRACSGDLLVDPHTQPPTYKPVVISSLSGGQFYKFSCPGNTKVPAGKCGYRPE